MLNNLNNPFIKASLNLNSEKKKQKNPNSKIENEDNLEIEENQKGR